MTTFTNTRVGQVTEVRTGLFTATIDVDTNGELPTVTVAGEQLPALRSRYNHSPRGLHYMDNAAPRWQGVLEVEGIDQSQDGRALSARQHDPVDGFEVMLVAHLA